MEMSAISMAISCPAWEGIWIRPRHCAIVPRSPSYRACTLTNSYGRGFFLGLPSTLRFGASVCFSILSSIRYTDIMGGGLDRRRHSSWCSSAIGIESPSIESTMSLPYLRGFFSPFLQVRAKTKKHLSACRVNLTSASPMAGRSHSVSRCIVLELWSNRYSTG